MENSNQNNSNGVGEQNTNLPPTNFEPTKKGSARWLVWVLLLIIIVTGGYFGLKLLNKSNTNSPSATGSLKSGFKTVTGCVQPLSTTIKLNFQLDVPKDYAEYNPNGGNGCGGNTYSDEIAYRIPGRLDTIMVSVYITAGSSVLPESIPVPALNNKYSISLARDSTHMLSNAEWAEILSSFKFK